VELEGTTVSRASVHNISIVEGLELGIGDEIEIYKANMIIPQIAENHTRSNQLIIPDKCPACGEATEIRQINDVKSLYCTNPECVAKKIKKFTLFVSRDALNIDGLSEETLEKLIDRGFIHSYADIFRLERYEEEIVNMYGFGRRSYHHLQDSVNHARNTELHALIYALGIPNIGLSNAKMICRAFDYDIEKVINCCTDIMSYNKQFDRLSLYRHIQLFMKLLGKEEITHLCIYSFNIQTFHQTIIKSLTKQEQNVLTSFFGLIDGNPQHLTEIMSSQLSRTEVMKNLSRAIKILREKNNEFIKTRFNS